VTALPDSVIAKPIKKVRARGTASARPPPSKAPKPLARARATALPAQIKPQLATLVAGVPSAGEWLYEIKFDGYRLMAGSTRARSP
jgi:bifunctional non-homologous end joining protein LigD